MADLVIVAGKADRARCKYCGASIVWVTTASQPGVKARATPLDGMPIAREETQNSGGIRFLTIDATQRHRCASREKQVTATARTSKRIREASRTGQGRMF